MPMRGRTALLRFYQLKLNKANICHETGNKLLHVVQHKHNLLAFSYTSKTLLALTVRRRRRSTCFGLLIDRHDLAFSYTSKTLRTLTVRRLRRLGAEDAETPAWGSSLIGTTGVWVSEGMAARPALTIAPSISRPTLSGSSLTDTDPGDIRIGVIDCLTNQAISAKS